MSRWGWNELYPPLMQVLSLYFIVRAARRRSWGDWAMAGFLLGLGMFTYLSIRLAVVAIVMYLAYRACGRARLFTPELAGSAGVRCVLRPDLCAARFHLLQRALYLPQPQPPGQHRPRHRSGRGQSGAFAESAKRHLLMFHVAGDANARHNLPGAPMLDPITGAFFLLGVGWAAWKWRDHRRGLALIWLGVTLLGGVFSQLSEAPQAYRTLAAAPAIALLCGDVYDLSLRGSVGSGAALALVAVAGRWRCRCGLAGRGLAELQRVFQQAGC